MSAVKTLMAGILAGTMLFAGDGRSGHGPLRQGYFQGR